MLAQSRAILLLRIILGSLQFLVGFSNLLRLREDLGEIRARIIIELGCDLIILRGLLSRQIYFQILKHVLAPVRILPWQSRVYPLTSRNEPPENIVALIQGIFTFDRPCQVHIIWAIAPAFSFDIHLGRGPLSLLSSSQLLNSLRQSALDLSSQMRPFEF